MARQKRCARCALLYASGASHDCASALAAAIQEASRRMQKIQDERAQLGRRLRSLWAEQARPLP